MPLIRAPRCQRFDAIVCVKDYAMIFDMSLIRFFMLTRRHAMRVTACRRRAMLRAPFAAAPL